MGEFDIGLRFRFCRNVWDLVQLTSAKYDADQVAGKGEAKKLQQKFERPSKIVDFHEKGMQHLDIRAARIGQFFAELSVSDPED